ncbi:MAG: acetyl-CoA carboxylase biotin carboxyl carrier protein [Candidatus Omnitrophica bacterium]|nr:acetyl-CoA carboxylase biotin carboxyl carrier protein [Candidatus Omnitrophota bacterium]
MNLKEIKEILALMNENNLNEIEIERDGLKLKLKKSSGGEVVLRSPETHFAVESIPAPKAPASGAAGTPSAAGDQSASGKGEIKSPMVGTFYRSPSPEAEPFVEVGQTVEVGQVVCIVEAMKLMNEIKSEIRGKITEVAVQNAEPVEFGQALFIIDPL